MTAKELIERLKFVVEQKYDERVYCNGKEVLDAYWVKDPDEKDHCPECGTPDQITYHRAHINIVTTTEVTKPLGLAQKMWEHIEKTI